MVELVAVLRHGLDDHRAYELEEPLLLVCLLLRLAQLLALLPPRLLRLAPLLFFLFVFAFIRRWGGCSRGEGSLRGGGGLRDDRGDIALALLCEEVWVRYGEGLRPFCLGWCLLGCRGGDGSAQLEVVLRRLMLIDEECVRTRALLWTGVDGPEGWY